MIRASAPGKLVLMGEYAVLHGHAAVVAAVGVRARCTRQGGPLDVERDPGGLVDACLRHAAAISGALDGRIVVDTAAFRSGADKFGLGSSAAACVALLRALLPHLQLDELHAVAQRAHRDFQNGRGSGVDVCASVFGGFQRFARVGDRVDVTAVDGLPDGVVIVPVWTGASTDTRDFIARVSEVQDLDELMSLLGAASERFQAARDPDALFAAVDDAGAALHALGQAADVDIVSDVHARIAAIAHRHGGAGKPSGAGGGDVSLCFVRAADEERCVSDLVAGGFQVLDFTVGEAGVDVVVDAP